MLSRRSIRIKVMQLLFSLSRDRELSYKEAEKRYWEVIDNTFNLYLYNLYAISQITAYAESDAEKRKSKHLPTEEDKVFSAKIFQNEIVQDLVGNTKLEKKFTSLNFEAISNQDYFKKIYNGFSKTEPYLAYLKKESTKQDHLDILLELYRYCRKDEFFNELMEDNFSNWTDDKSVVVGTFKKSVKILPASDPKFYDAHFPDAETIKDFGSNLLKQTNKLDEELLTIIKPSLKNWDHDRLAVLDMIILKMAITELMTFPTIPTKVTLNEYVEVAKMYSTAKSKDFINGVLDKLKTDLEEAGKVKKEGRGLVD